MNAILTAFVYTLCGVRAWHNNYYDNECNMTTFVYTLCGMRA